MNSNQAGFKLTKQLLICIVICNGNMTDTCLLLGLSIVQLQRKRQGKVSFSVLTW